MNDSVTLKVDGMSCDHCVRAVTEAIRAEDPSATVAVDLKAGAVTATTSLARQRIADLVEAEGYRVAQG
ncbi:heavy-metal-associated domain-containing protein [Pseudoroseomonas globiformis]|uniref:Heavy-metal-associated domain-containing protein n=1 Tax=Teichococcus globiformis TaxID=2307229 RepID=A0ABV7G0M7_9PROT